MKVSGSGNGHRRRPAKPSVSVVIPALNEARNLAARPRRRLPRAAPRGHPRRRQLDRRHRRGRARAAARTSRSCSQTRTGKGNALACGFAAVTGDIIVMLDADGSADPAEIPAFVAALVAGRRLRQGLAASPTAAAATTSPRFAQLGQRRAQPGRSTCCSAPATPTSATATTPSGPHPARCSTCPPLHAPQPRRRHALGRRLRDRDPDQHPRRRGRG